MANCGSFFLILAGRPVVLTFQDYYFAASSNTTSPELTAFRSSPLPEAGAVNWGRPPFSKSAVLKCRKSFHTKKRFQPAPPAEAQQILRRLRRLDRLEICTGFAGTKTTHVQDGE